MRALLLAINSGDLDQNWRGPLKLVKTGIIDPLLDQLSVKTAHLTGVSWLMLGHVVRMYTVRAWPGTRTGPVQGRI